ncbi:MAG: hypothetical protein KY476_03800 [Planctomycetes bacterium]|nr:hypothetical protein [Planctomycetota bacterium]
MDTAEARARRRAFLADFIAASRQHGLQAALALRSRLAEKHGLADEHAGRLIEAHLQGASAEDDATEAARIEQRRVARAQLREELAARLEHGGGIDYADARWARAAGARLGLPELDVEVLLAETEARQRELRRKQGRLVRLRDQAVTTALCLIAMAGVGGGLYWYGSTSEAPGEAVVAPADRLAPPREGPPAWWTVNLRLAVRKLPLVRTDGATLAEKLQSDADAERLAAYVALLKPLPADPAARKPIAEIAVEAYVGEAADANAAAIRERLFGLIPTANNSKPFAAVDGLETAFWAVETACDALRHAYLPDERESALVASFQQTLAFRADRGSPTLKADSAAALCRHLYGTLAAAEGIDPELMRKWFQDLAERADALIKDERERGELDTQLLLSAADRAGEAWTHYRERLERMLASPDQKATARLIGLYEQTQNAGLRSFLESALAKRAGLDTPAASTAETVRLVRRRLGIPSQGPAAAAIDPRRLSKLLKEAAAALDTAKAAPRPGDSEAFVESVLRLARVSTMAAAMASPDRALGTSRFDDLLKQGTGSPPADPADAAVSVRGNGVPLALTPAVSAQQLQNAFPPAGDPSREFEIAVLTLTPRSKKNRPEDRIQAIEDIANRIAADESLSPQFAEVIAGYLLDAKGKDEHDAALAQAAALGRSRDLLLAVADRLEDPPGRREQVVETVEALLATKAADPPDGQSWNDALRIGLLRGALHRLKFGAPASAPARVPAARGGSALDRGREALRALYVEQAALLGVDATRVAGLTRPVDVLDAIVRRRAAAINASAGPRADAAFVARVPHELEVASRRAPSSLHRLVLVERVWLRVLVADAVRRGGRSPRAEAILASLAAADAAADDVLGQLRDGEQALVEMWLVVLGQ